MALTKSQELFKTLRFALPIMFGQIGQMLMGVTDSVMVGHLGTVPLAASSFVNSVFGVPFVFLIGVSTAISVKVSQAYGANNRENIRQSFWTGSVLTISMAILVTLILILLQGQLHWFRQPPEVLKESLSYYIVMAISFVPMMVFFSAKSFSDSFSDSIAGSLVLFAGLLLNILFNWIFIYGNWGAPALGLFGAGVATLICRIIIAAMMVSYVFLKPRYNEYTTALLKLPILKSRMIEIAKIGIPSGLQFFFEVCAFAGAGIMMGWISTEALAAHQVAISLASITFMIAMSMGYASSVRVGQAYGSGQLNLAKTIGLTSLYFVIVVEIIFTILFIVFRNWLPTLYIQDPAVIEIAANMLIVAAVFQLVDGIQTLGIGLLRGLSDMKVPTYITLFCYWGIGLTLSVYLGFYTRFSYMGVWSALAIALLFAAVLLFLRFYFVTRKLEAIMAKAATSSNS